MKVQTEKTYPNIDRWEEEELIHNPIFLLVWHQIPSSIEAKTNRTIETIQAVMPFLLRLFFCKDKCLRYDNLVLRFGANSI